ncbi:MAG: class I tRNA ligase family protein [Coriobacteriia bacterium]|nr:class I tRNA ligase family protein [Coriobacteriia bacterium]
MPFLNKSAWPKRAVVTAGMPYGNKPLHFGHVGGVFVPADCFARFLRDRIGAENVRFICGTDCFGSPINEGYRKLVEAGEFEGSIRDYVGRNHDAQKATLDAYDISLSVYEGSGLGHCGEVHQQLSEQFIQALYDQGWLHRESTLQFYDAQADTILNGRQVQGFCPVQGCKSEKAYADECDLGHQFNPEDLLRPVSTLTGTVPEMRPVENWYFDLPAFTEYLRTYVDEVEADPTVRAVVSSTAREFLVPPIIFVKNDLEDAYRAVAAQMPAHEFLPAEKGKQSFGLQFSNLADRDAARHVLGDAGIRFRTGKALVPFRITGNIEWGVGAPVIEGVEGLTVWCWPESLWAPISFTKACNDMLGLPAESWKDFWCAEDAQVYQFIGQDNLYFYGVAQPAMFEAVQLAAPGAPAPGSAAAAAFPLRQTKLVANHHILFGKTKASSSGAVKPPTADELLDFYTVDQLRAHWLALGLDQKSVGFSPKPFDPDPAKREDPRVADPALKEGALLTNVFNRLARSCFYEAQKNFDGCMPLDAPTPAVVEAAHKVLAAYDATMQKVELHSIISLMDEYIRAANKRWADGISAAEKAQDDAARRQVLVDAFFELRVCTLLMHPVVPAGCERIREHLQFAAQAFYCWDAAFEGMAELCTPDEVAASAHAIDPLPPRYDFFEKHPSQLK